jgi:hypothetical protein
MKRKNHLLIALSAAVLLFDVSAASAQGRGEGRGEGRNKGEQQGNSERGGPGVGFRGNGGGQDRGGQDRGGDRGNFRGGQQQQPQAQPQPQQPQRQFGNGQPGGGQPNGWQTRMRDRGQQQAAPDAQRQQRPEWANGGQGAPRGGDQSGWQNRVRQPDRPAQAQPQPQQPRQDFSNRGGDRNGQGQRDFGRNDGRANPPAFAGNRREPNATARYDQRFGQRYDYRRDNWAGRNDWARYDRRNRSQVTVRFGTFFGPSYGTIASRFYGRSYIYYSSHRWNSWNRPWRVGYVLPPTSFCEPLPYDLYFDLPPPPWGYDYALCDGDILLIGTDTGVVYDAILPY